MFRILAHFATLLARLDANTSGLGAL